MGAHLGVTPGPGARSRVVFVHSRDRLIFLGTLEEGESRELEPRELEALASAGFEIVEVNKSDGTPLCATLAGVPEGEEPDPPNERSSPFSLVHLDR